MRTAKRIAALEIRSSIRSIREYRKLQTAFEKGWFPSLAGTSGFSTTLAHFHFRFAEQLITYREIAR